MNQNEKKTRRRGSLVGPVILIGLGVVLLLNNLNVIDWNVWEVIIRLWPVLLVAAGLDLLIGHRSTWGSLLALILTIGLVAGALWLFGSGLVGPQTSVQEIKQGTEGAARAEIVVGSAVGGLNVKAQSEPGALVTGQIHTVGQEQVTQDFRLTGKGEDQTAVFKLQSSGDFVGFPASGDTHPWDLALTPDLPMMLEVNMGVGSVDLDLRGLDLSDLDVSIGVGQVTVILPNEGRFKATIGSAIGSTVIVIPAEMEARINFSTGLSGRSVPANFDRRGDAYTSPGYQGAEHRIDLDVSQAIGSVSVQHLRGE